MTSFRGAKIALFAPGGLVVIRRDDIPGIPWPGRVDLPGGGREDGETPVETVRRETREEIGIDPDAARFEFARDYPRDGEVDWLFGARLDAAEVSDIRFGGEGQGWWVDPLEVYLARDDAIPHQQARLRDVLRAMNLP